MIKNQKEKPKIAIALGSGGARGVSYIGFLRALQESGIKIDILTGTSVGAIIGGAYAAGISIDEIERFTKKLRQSSLVDYSLPINGGFVKGNKASKVLKNFFYKNNANLTFSKTKIKFGCAATDLVSGEVVYLSSGNILPAIRASFSISGIFRPVKKGNMILVDGGPLCRVPVRLARKLGADIVIGVDCAGPNLPVEPNQLVKWSKIITRMFLLMEYCASKEEIYESDYLITFNLNNVDPLKLKDGVGTIEYGYKQGKLAAQKILKIINEYKQ